MNRQGLVCAAFVVAGITAAADTGADESHAPPSPPLGGPELTMGVGYARAFGVDAVAASSETGGGLGTDLALGLRRSRWTLAIDASHAELETSAGRRYLTTGAGLAATFHLMPAAAYAPWIRTGIGYRYVKHGTVDAHGIQVGHVLAGIDLRASTMISVAPAVGVELVLLPFRAASAEQLESLQTAAFFGLLGRFDFSPLAE